MSADLYEILEIDSTATGGEIKKAYRKLALKYHPDKVSEDDRNYAETRFKEICHAYEILIDEVKREEYDTYGTTDGRNTHKNEYGFTGNPFDDFYGDGHQREYNSNDFYSFFNNMNGHGGPPGGPRRRSKPRTDDAELNVTVSLEDLFKGKTIKTTSTRNIICTHCNGSGAKKNAVSKQCNTCEGEGFVRKIRRVGPGLVTQEYVDCHTCKSTGKVYRTKSRCKSCHGEKVIEETKILEFEILKGSRDGESIILKGESDEYPGKETGDIIMTFHCIDHHLFTRKGDDLFVKYKITLVDALCGFSKVLLKHLDGRGIHVSTPKGKVLRPGDYLKIKNEGMPVKQNSKVSRWFSGNQNTRGDLYIEIEIEFPEDNWYLEKNDLLKINNLLPNELMNKKDVERQKIDKDSLPEANIELITDFTIARSNALPDYPEEHTNETKEQEEFYAGRDEYTGQPECTQQ